MSALPPKADIARRDDHVPNGYLFNALAVGADSDLVTTKISDQAAVEMADNPTSGDYHLVSAFQSNLTFILSERYFGATVLRSNGIALITGYS
jgi:hypothetical protein